MKNYLIAFLFTVSCTCTYAQYIPHFNYFLADYTAGETNIYKIEFENNAASLTFIANIQTEVCIAYRSDENLLYAINKSGNQLQTLDINAQSPTFSSPVILNFEMGEITAATFDDYGILFLGSADQNKIYSIDISNYSIQVYDDYAPVGGGDLASDFAGGLYLTSQLPNGLYKLNPSQSNQDFFLGSVSARSTGLACFEDGNYLFSVRDKDQLELRSATNSALITHYDLFLEGERFTLSWGDMASGFNPFDFPIPSDDCDYRQTFYADYNGITTNIYAVGFNEEQAYLYSMVTLDLEAHIAITSNGIIFAVHTDGSQITAIDEASGYAFASIPLNLNPSHITAVAAEGNVIYFGDQISRKIYTIDPLSINPEPVFFADAPINGGDMCFFDSELFIANKGLKKLFKYNGTDFDAIGNLPPNVTGITAYSNFNGSDYEDGLVISCSGSNILYSISPDNGNVLSTFSVSKDGSPFSLHYGDLASYCNNAQIDMYECTALQFVDYTEGTTSTGGSIPNERTDPNMALGYPDVPGEIDFVTLGYGGSITLNMGGYIQNGPGADLEIFETSPTTAGCDDYPEFADVSLSVNGVDWIFLGTVCKSQNTLDISDATDLDLFQFVKIANNDLLTTTDDGFDLNAVTTLHPCYALEQERLVSPEATFVANEIHVSPNPGSGISKLVIVPNSDGYLRTDILDLNGRIVKSLIDKYATREERIETEFSVMDLPNGVYLIRTTTENSSSVEKFIVAR